MRGCHADGSCCATMIVWWGAHRAGPLCVHKMLCLRGRGRGCSSSKSKAIATAVQGIQRPLQQAGAQAVARDCAGPLVQP